MIPGRAVHRRNLSRAALAVAAIVAVGGCSRTHDCRPGTLFLNVQFAPYTGVEQVFVQVMVSGEATRSMTFDVRPAGATSGSVEVSFVTYPEGKRADVVVRLQGAGGDLAMRSIGVDLTGGCVAADVNFSTTDGGGGAGGRGGSTGAGGVAGTVGAAGTTGFAGTGGGAAGTVGAAGTSGAAGRGGTTGTAGVAGMGAAGTGGVAGTGGGGRGGNTAGTGGTTGLAGRGGTTGAGGRGGTGGACTATGAETCFNNLDDDCDGNVDCADTDCTAGAVCVALDPTQGMLGVVMPDATTPCPANYTTATTINRAPVQAQCSGCSCSRPPVNCVATIYDYPSYAACMTDPSSQTQVGMFSSGLACQTPNWHPYDPDRYVFGVGMSAPTPMYPGCTPGGTATAGAPTWAVTTRFCATTLRGGGCATGSVCLPAITNNPPRCVMAAGGGACPTGTQRSDWYTGYTGNFACNPCSCGQTEGASCAGVQLVVGNGGSCTSASMYAVLLGAAHVCAPPGALLNPAIVFTGTPTSPTCAPQNTSSGSLTPTGPQAVCCR